LPKKNIRRSPVHLAFRRIIQYAVLMPERTQRPAGPAPWGPKEGDSGGPKSPDVSKPDVKDLLQRMRKVDPNQSRRYRQRTGQ
jgi:Prokaryotic ubiquitin-like protein UBact